MKLKILILLLFPCTAFSQFKGLWNGYINSERPLKSYYILDVKEEFDGVVKGDAYLYRTQYLTFLGKMNFVGTIENGKLSLSELKLLINKKPITNEDFCYKNMILEISDKDGRENLTGPWQGYLSTRDWCAPGRVYLRRFTTENDNGFDSIPKEILAQINGQRMKPDSFLNTKLSLPRVIDIQSRRISIEVRDYDKVDNDIISVYVNREKVIDKKKIKRTSIKRTLLFDPNVQINEVVIYAHNLGEIPPNTSEMMVDDGYTRQKIKIESSLQQSALIYLRYRYTEQTATK